MKNSTFFTITETRETTSHKKTNHQARARWRKDNPPDDRPNGKNTPVRFICIDGEGMTFPDGTHRYVLLSIGDKSIQDPGGLALERIFAFLWEHYEPGGTAYCGYFLGYDFTQWLKTLPEYKARRLLTSEGQTARIRRTHGNYTLYWPVDWKGWEFDILGGKRLKFRPQGTTRWMYICDTGGFFQQSFLKTIDPEKWITPVITQEEYDDIATGKKRRDVAVLDDEMRRYNTLENEICARVLHELDTGFRQLGIQLSPRQWFGPGQAAAAWLKDKLPSGYLSKVPKYFLEAARASYYGGWFEIMAHGIIPGRTYEYDINSAYPNIISTLPCLLHGRYSRGMGKPTSESSAYVLVYATVWRWKPGSDDKKGMYIGSMLHRYEGENLISRPQVTEGWFWKHELDAAIRAGMVVRPKNEQYKAWAMYQPCDCPPPLAGVADIYKLRQKVGKKTPLGMACKLVPNSLYGKFAQSVGNPEYGNPVYASLITAGCRTQITNAIATHPDKLRGTLMVATDGVYFSSPHPGLTLSGELGDWEKGIKDNLTLFKPGMYWDDNARQIIHDGKIPPFKSRGVNSQAFSRELNKIDNQFQDILDTKTIPQKWPSVEFTIGFSMVTALNALHRNAWETAGKVTTDTKAKQSSSPYTKRYWAYIGDEGFIRSEPIAYHGYTEYGNYKSQSYQKRFGMDDPFSELTRGEYGITPDGTPGQIWKEILL